MAEDTARALGAGIESEIKFGGKKISIRALNVRELLEVERDCVRLFRKGYLENLAETADLLADGQDMLREEMIKSASWDGDDLPEKLVHGISDKPITPEMRSWLKNNVRNTSDEALDNPVYYKRLVLHLLDKEALSAEEFEKRTGESVERQSTPYVNWWITASPEGMVSFFWHMVKDQNVTRDEVESEFTNRLNDLVSATREIETLSAPDTKNGQDS